MVFKNVSMAGTGLIISALAFLLPIFGVTVDQGTITQFVDNVAQAIGFILLVWGQLRRPDLHFGFIRRFPR